MESKNIYNKYQIYLLYKKRKHNFKNPKKKIFIKIIQRKV